MTLFTLLAMLAIAVLLIIIVAVMIGAGWFLLAERPKKESEILADFWQKWPMLKDLFHAEASTSGRPRGLEWVACEFDDDVAFARFRTNGMLAAFAAVTIHFAAEEGGPMEDVEAVGMPRAATAIFHYRPQGWTTRGQTVFNLSPREAIAHYQAEFEPVEMPTA